MAIDLENTIDYYVNLLIIQYNQLEKAKATIELNIRTLLSDNIVSQVQDGYDLETAIGKQLDVLGGYIGADRFFTRINIAGSFFGMTSYSTLLTDTTVGLTDYANYNTDPGGFLTYGDLLSAAILDDDDYRFILKIKIVQNNSDHSNGSIATGLFQFFANDLVLSDGYNMTIVYFVSGANLNRALIAFSKGILPRPMGVGITGLIERNEKIFGFTNYNAGLISSNVTGFTNYIDGFTKEGETLNYKKVITL